MSLNKRLKKLEAKLLPDKQIMVIKFGNEITELKFQGEIFNRLEDESEVEFIARIRKLVSAMPDRPLVSLLVGNF